MLYDSILLCLIVAVHAAPMAYISSNDSTWWTPTFMLAPQEDEEAEDGLTPVSRALIATVCLFAFFIALHTWQYYTFRRVCKLANISSSRSEQKLTTTAPVLASHGSHHTAEEDNGNEPDSGSEEEFVECRLK